MGMKGMGRGMGMGGGMGGGGGGGNMLAMSSSMGNLGGPPQMSGCVVIVSNLDEGVRFLLFHSTLCLSQKYTRTLV